MSGFSLQSVAEALLRLLGLVMPVARGGWAEAMKAEAA